MAPITGTEGALTRQLHTAIMVVADLAETKRFYADGLGLVVTGPIEVDDAIRRTQRTLWRLPDDLGWQLYVLRRPVNQTIQVRVLVLDRATPAVRATWDFREPGPFSLGFPAAELEPWDAELGDMGFTSTSPMSRYQMPRPDGSRYGVHETIWKAPDFLHAVTCHVATACPSWDRSIDDPAAAGRSTRHRASPIPTQC